ncbi:MAG: hypothetical protein ACOYKJ_00530 [Candidatus Howiella sp.]
MLENLLNDDKIPFLKNRMITYNYVMPQAYDRCDYYVPCSAPDKAQELLCLANERK